MPSERVVICRSNPVAPDPRVQKTAETLTQAGYAVQILAWDRSGVQPFPETEALAIRRLVIPARYGTGLGNLKALLRWQWGLLAWLLRNRRNFEIIHACDFDTVLPALILKWGWRKKVIYDIFDFYADHLRATPAAVKNLIRRIDQFCVGQADGLIVADDSRWEQLDAQLPVARAVIYNSPRDVGVGSPLQRDESAPTLTLVYIGLIQVERGLLEMLAVIQQHSRWQLHLAGFGGDEEEISARAAQLENVIWHGRVAYSQTIALSRAADVLFATYDPAIANHRYASPNKVFEALMLAKPLVVARGTNIDRIVRANHCGLVVEYGDRAQLEAALTLLVRSPGLRRRLSENARRAYERAYTWDIMAARLEGLYAGVLNSV